MKKKRMGYTSKSASIAERLFTIQRWAPKRPYATLAIIENEENRQQ
ncbi:hypothetical protein [Novosphingobium sp.]|jgi:hypothetical protein